MTRLVRIAALACVAGALVATAALANVPDPSKSTLGINLPVGTARTYIIVEGATSGVPDSPADGRSGDYTVEVRDFSNNPISGSSVVIDFVGATPGSGGDTQIACDQLNAATGQSYISPSKVGGSTAANGRFTFKVQGASNSTTISLASPNQSDGIPLADPPAAKVYADGVLLGSLYVTHYDINGAGSPTTAVNSADVSTASAENVRGALSGIRYRRTDIDTNGSVGSSDVSRFAQVANDQALGTGSRNTAPYCP